MTRPNSVKHHKSHERDAPAPVASDSFKTVCNGVNWEWPVAIRGRKMLPTTRFSNLRRFTRIAQCVTAVARLCKSITPNADCYFLLLKCCQSEKRKIDSIAAVRKPLAALAKTGLYLAGPSFAAGIAPSTVSYASHPRKVLRISPGRDSRCLIVLPAR
jgi:hypothetical protein